MCERLALVRQDAGASREPQVRRTHRVAPRAQPGSRSRTAPRPIETNPATSTAIYRELDQRTADGLTVTLEWNPATDALRVGVIDREIRIVRFAVRGEDASDAFAHPFVYAGRAAWEIV
jgi:hypothetical protein